MARSDSGIPPIDRLIPPGIRIVVDRDELDRKVAAMRPVQSLGLWTCRLPGMTNAMFDLASGSRTTRVDHLAAWRQEVR